MKSFIAIFLRLFTRFLLHYILIFLFVYLFIFFILFSINFLTEIYLCLKKSARQDLPPHQNPQNMNFQISSTLFMIKFLPVSTFKLYNTLRDFLNQKGYNKRRSILLQWVDYIRCHKST